ncbi:Cytochrome c-552 [Pandoraea aquatica]|uniref:Cytochrome c-552 n=1 Tax=Pandoraea aquatica TaxID=2508290 RepID=A0A5E4US08_9BURK|nr:c-type cytochrome [Pandoraea aquatica]VVE01220.1 Cytochrome c-552 [Pandoraea aquatica]
MKFSQVSLSLVAAMAVTVHVGSVWAAPSASEQTCRACHDMNSKKVGPSFREIAASYRNDPDALAKIKKSILQGSSGKWGNIPMPANAIPDDEAERFAHWVMSLNK